MKQSLIHRSILFLLLNLTCLVWAKVLGYSPLTITTFALTWLTGAWLISQIGKV